MLRLYELLVCFIVLCCRLWQNQKKVYNVWFNSLETRVTKSLYKVKSHLTTTSNSV